MTEEGAVRYEFADVRPGFVVIERDVCSRATRAYFSAEPVPPKESYREGDAVWNFADAAQSFQFAVRERATGEVTRFDELLGLLYYGCAEPGSTLHQIGEIAHAVGISVYAAIAYASPRGDPLVVPGEKLQLLNRAFNERLRTPGKRILIVPDLFDLHAQISHGQLMLDFRLVDLPPAGVARPAKEKSG